MTNATAPNLYCYIGGLIGYNSNLGSLQSSYYQGKIVCTSYQDIKSNDLNKYEGTVINVSDAFIAGICGRNEVDLLSNFSDCYISGAGTGSLKTGVEKGNSYADLAFCSLKFNSKEVRNAVSTKTKYGTDNYSCLVDISSDEYLTKHYKSANTSASKSWTEFLAFKGFLLNNNYKIEKFYPTITAKIGFNNDSEGLQNNLNSFDPIQIN